jgi:activator of 2-hydroxyglutaryl-CoA dehydratase
LATARAVAHAAPDATVAVELGGEDAKLLYLGQDVELRMNESCAGGTGAFIDQMARLLNTDAGGLNALAERHSTLYPIASRCGVFAKTDIVPLLNGGVPREDIAASIFQAVVEQTIGGLACGRPIAGKVAFLGGPLHFLPELKKLFIASLNLGPEAVVSLPYAQCAAAVGAALCVYGEIGRAHV